MRKKLLMLAGGLCLTLGMSNLQAQELSDNVQVYVFDEEQQGQWFGVSMWGISDNGKYAVGYDEEITLAAVIWDIDSRSFRQITGSYNDEARAFDVSDDGTVVGVFAGEPIPKIGTPLLPGYWKDGVWKALPLVEGISVAGQDVNGYAKTISPDGTIITGYIRDWFFSEEQGENITLCRPAVWINGVLQPAFDNLPKREELQQGLFPSRASADGKILGGMADHPTGTRSPAIWVNGEMTRLYGEKDVDPSQGDVSFFDGLVGGISPNGKYVAGYWSLDGGASSLTAFVYNTETKEKEELAGWGMATAILDNGTVYGSNGYMGSAMVRTSDYNGKLTDYLVEKYGIDKEELECSPSNVLAASADGKVIGGFSVASTGFGTSMLPYIVVMDHPLSVQAAKNIQTLRMEGYEIVSDGAERIELYDVSGCKLNSVAASQVSVSGLNGLIIAKAFYANGTTEHAKFVIR